MTEEKEIITYFDMDIAIREAISTVIRYEVNYAEEAKKLVDPEGEGKWLYSSNLPESVYESLSKDKRLQYFAELANHWIGKSIELWPKYLETNRERWKNRDPTFVLKFPKGEYSHIKILIERLSNMLPSIHRHTGSGLECFIWNPEYMREKISKSL